MSSAPQVAIAVDSDSQNVFETDSRAASHSTGSVSKSCPRVLLVGRNGSWGTTVLKSLETFGSEFFFAPPEAATAEYIRKDGYALVLLDTSVAAEQRRQLASRLLGSSASIFFAFPVENGCWWLPALLRGRDCHGAPAFRRREFPFELERVLRDQAAA